MSGGKCLRATQLIGDTLQTGGPFASLCGPNKNFHYASK
jgi:hypothetical protein